MQTQAASDKAELIKDVLSLPAQRQVAGRAAGSAPASGELEALFRGRMRYLRGLFAGTPAGTALGELLPRNHGKLLLPAIAKTLEAESRGTAVVRARNPAAPELNIQAFEPSLYGYAHDAVSAGRFDDAIVALGLVASSATGRGDGLLGLAICAVRLQRYEAARALAAESLKHRPNHPRACCIIGLAALERGDRKIAQHQLAMAARMARRQPEFRDELRAAQRLLLMMHIA